MEAIKKRQKGIDAPRAVVAELRLGSSAALFQMSAFHDVDAACRTSSGGIGIQFAVVGKAAGAVLLEQLDGVIGLMHN